MLELHHSLWRGAICCGMLNRASLSMAHLASREQPLCMPSVFVLERPCVARAHTARSGPRVADTVHWAALCRGVARGHGVCAL